MKIGNFEKGLISLVSWEYFWEGFCLFWEGMVEFFTGGMALTIAVAFIAIMTLAAAYFVPTMYLNRWRARLCKAKDWEPQNVCALVLSILAQIALILAGMAVVFAASRDNAVVAMTLVVELFLVIATR